VAARSVTFNILAAAIIASRQASASAVMIAPPIVLLALFIDFYLPNR
jgi:hypothetical protein